MGKNIYQNYDFSNIHSDLKLRKHNMKTENFDAILWMFVKLPNISNEQRYILAKTYVGIIFMVSLSFGLLSNM